MKTSEKNTKVNTRADIVAVPGRVVIRGKESQTVLFLTPSLARQIAGHLNRLASIAEYMAQVEDGQVYCLAEKLNLLQ